MAPHLRHCHYFGFPKRVSLHRFATFPFVFMVETETATLCGSCMRTEAWINLRGNLLSVVGVPISAVKLLLAHLGGSRRYKRFVELDRANEAATNEKPERAEVLYERLLDRVAPRHHFTTIERSSALTTRIGQAG